MLSIAFVEQGSSSHWLRLKVEFCKWKKTGKIKEIYLQQNLPLFLIALLLDVIVKSDFHLEISFPMQICTTI